VIGRLFCEYGGFEMKLDLKSVLTGSAATIALVAASSANASGYYIGLFGGISSMEDSFTVTTATSSTSTTSSTSGGGLNFLGFVGATTASSLSISGTKGPTWDTAQNPLVDTAGTIGTTTGATGLYGIGFSTLRYSVTNAARSTTFGASSVGFDDGWIVGAAIGWDFGNGWRSELEAAYRSHDVDSSAINGSFSRAYTGYAFGYNSVLYMTYTYTRLTYVGVNTVTKTGTFTYTNAFSSSSTTGSFSTGTSGAGRNGNVDGDLETWSFMFNVWYDFDFGDSPIKPFVGAGIGFAHASLDFDMTTAGSLPTSGYGFFGSGGYGYRGNGESTDWGFAYQLGAGLGYDLGNGMTLSAQYRYFNTGAMDLSLADQIEVNLESHNILVGLNVPLGGGM